MDDCPTLLVLDQLQHANHSEGVHKGAAILLQLVIVLQNQARHGVCNAILSVSPELRGSVEGHLLTSNPPRHHAAAKVV